MTRHREQAINTYFAALISGYGLSASQEEILESGNIGLTYSSSFAVCA